ncbi:MAG: hypothetical protein DMF08_12550 [Verrucomicrobia bacterium]|nr:MAG: hypothetical protein DMF08_12550 [Verrucomicrobiota bacterium]
MRHAETSALPSRAKRHHSDWKSIAGGAAAGPTFRDVFLRTCFAVSVTGYDPSRSNTQIYDCHGRDRLVKTHPRVKNAATAGAGREPCRVVVAGDSSISELTLAAILVRDKRYDFDVWAHGLYDARQVNEPYAQSDKGKP